MADKLMYIPNEDIQNTLSVDYDQCLKPLDTQLNEPTNQNLIKVPKVVQPTNKKTFLMTLGTSVINIPMYTPSMNYYTWI